MGAAHDRAVVEEYREENFDVTVGDSRYWMGALKLNPDNKVELSAHAWDEERGGVIMTQEELVAFIAGLQELVVQ